MPPDVSTLSFKLKAKTLTSGPPPSSCCCCEKMATVRCVPRIYTTRFRLKNVERFMFMKYFDDTAMFLHGQRISSISTDTLDTDEIFMINEEFLICNHARMSSLSRRAQTEKLAMGSSGLASGPHMLYEWLRMKTGLVLNHVPYK